MNRLTYRAPRCRNLGAAVALIVAAAEKVQSSIAAINDDMRAFHAPSECGLLAMRGVEAPLSEAIAKASALTGLPPVALAEEITARAGGRWWGWRCYSMMIPGNLNMSKW